MRWIVLLFAFIYGCAAKGPQTPDALRQEVTASKAQTFEVRGRHRDVAMGLQRQAQKCLDKKTYKPTLIVSSRKAELHVVREQAGDVQYVLVADALPVRRDRTSVQVYASNGYDALVAAVKAWASGRDARCPDIGNTG